MTESASVRILVLRGGAIGDFIVTLPVLQKLRAHWPAAHIELIGYPHVAQLACVAGLVDCVASLDQAEIARFFSLRPVFTDAQRDYIASFHFIISYLHDPDGTVRENLLTAGARQVLYGPPLITAGHAIESLLKPLETFALYAEGVERPCLKLGPEPLEWGRKWLAEYTLKAPVLMVHPGSGSPRKNWPLDNFVALLRNLPHNIIPLLILGEADASLASLLARDLPDVPVLAGCSLLEVASVLAHAAAYLGNDSGITHLAAALGVPVVALFGPSNPEHWAPRGPRVQIIQAPDGKTPEIPLATVRAAVLHALEK